MCVCVCVCVCARGVDRPVGRIETPSLAGNVCQTVSVPQKKKKLRLTGLRKLLAWQPDDEDDDRTTPLDRTAERGTAHRALERAQ